MGRSPEFSVKDDKYSFFTLAKFVAILKEVNARILKMKDNKDSGELLLEGKQNCQMEEGN